MDGKEMRGILVWVVVAALSAAVLPWVFPRAYPLYPQGWQVSKAEAEAIALERLRDLGELPDDPYVITVLDPEPVVEDRLLDELERRPAEEVTASRLARDALAWQVLVYDADAAASDWSYQARVSTDGGVLELRLRVPPEEEGGAIDPQRARSRADRFLQEQGLDLALFDEPEIRTRQLQSRSDTYLRYRDREALLGPDRPYGLEVTFAGERLAGYDGYREDADEDAVKSTFRPFVLLQQAWIFVTLLLLPLVAIPFVRRYHAGEVGVRRGVQISMVVVACGILTMAFTARAAAAGWQVGVLTKPQVTLVVVFQMLVLFFFPTALMAFLSWSVGESICRHRWGAKLAAFDAFFKGDWFNGTFARAALRGLASGLAIAALLWLLQVWLQPLGVRSYSLFLLGPWWENASWFSVPLLSFGLAYALYAGLFGRLLLVSLGARLAGRWLGPALAVLLGAVLFFPSTLVVPLTWNVPFWLLGPALFVVLFLRYGIFTSILAYLTCWVAMGAVPFLLAEDLSMQLQASLALLVAAVPLIASARYLLSDRQFVYRYEDIPPHVRRIAERERQKVELETARRIQTSILPELPPQLLGVSMAYSYLPATEVGGDFYDVMALEDGRLAVAVGDVAGHGVSSGLVMSMTKSALAVQVTFDPDVEAVFTTLNRMVFQSARKRLLATLCYALIDPDRRQMSYASAGHLFPYRVTLGAAVQALESISYPLGVRDRIAVRERSTRLESGDLIFLFSDGVVEARPENSDEQFGFDRLEASLARHAAAGVGGLKDGVLADLESFTGGAPREDDLTVIVLGMP